MDLRLERRISPRRNTYIEATIAFSSGRDQHPCVVRNVSDSGAKLEVRTPVAKFPNSFELLVKGHRPQTCRVVWRALREMGVQFV